MNAASNTSLAIVVIGRNEGTRLLNCLASLSGLPHRVVYVDSGSTDGSVDSARSAGVEVVKLDPNRPFTAARARNAGFYALQASGVPPQFVQFLDGDCALENGWLQTARAHILGDASLGLVTGWRQEVDPKASIYNALCDFEWHRPAGKIIACGGDMLVRSAAFSQIGGFNETVIAAEDDEFCQRLAAAGWNLWRLPQGMSQHDAAMLHFPQWWHRATRSGHGFAQVGALHPGYFAPEKRRVLVYAALLPLLALLALIYAPLWLVPLVALYPLSYGRTVLGLQRQGLKSAAARQQALLLSLSKFPNLYGMLVYHMRKFRGAAMQIIEYK